MNLVPFSPESLKIEAKLEAEASGFLLSFELSGEKIKRVLLAEKSVQPSRKNELWKQTCFECFFATGGGQGYFEFNGSPSGDWALYSFDAYREGMKEVPLGKKQMPVLEKFECVPQQGQAQDQAIGKIICVWRIPQFTESFIVTAGVTAVVVFKEDGQERSTYWALKHAGEKPDFHLKESFVHRFF